MTYDVVVIGGGPAGLSGAVALGRALRSVLVIDSGAPRNAPAAGIHNFLTRDGMKPAEFRAVGRAEAERYGAEFVDSEVVSVDGKVDDFRVVTDGGEYRGRRLLVTSGLVDQLPEVPGLAARWGTTVLHCPYCHGYEARGKAIGVIGSDRAAEQVRLWKQWSPDVRLLPVEEIARVEDGGVRMRDGSWVARDYLVVATRLAARAGFLEDLGLVVVEGAMGTYVPVVDPSGRTAVPGVWVAGNVAEPMAQVITSAAAGLTAGAMINFDLLPEEPTPAAP
ncbi:NAD(P)/FAD-dependent oxidoreductase [Actinoplanes sp. TBRC 11911]|uniref:NAD(P)/FAD-dependent oxidoreductase n=1 Tax=Actinoplanes sp. TBRC 11911 TaxID=2729386 RepID=UPI00145E470F|nr:NAD(P)/FAD-dependent oxidoreductase [Actinoplanes sp. TBRC 11911]NMO52979.1 NAD(P)/FAD-dependent oxidoreductase [Actinoplanes sp. TBRC 11911]